MDDASTAQSMPDVVEHWTPVCCCSCPLHSPTGTETGMMRALRGLRVVRRSCSLRSTQKKGEARRRGNRRSASKQLDVVRLSGVCVRLRPSALRLRCVCAWACV